MDRKQFLVALKRQLWWRLPPEELSTVLEDYNEYFDSGTAVGKSEAELCAQFGEPRAIAGDIVTEQGSKYYAPTLVSMGLCAGLLLFCMIFVTRPAWLWNTGFSGQHLLHLATLVMSALSIGYVRRTVGTHPSRRLAICVTVLGTLLALFMVVLSVLMLNLLPLMETYSAYIAPEKLGPTVEFVFYVFTVFATGLWFACLFFCARMSRWQAVLFPVCAMSLSLLLSYTIILGAMSAPEALTQVVVMGIQISLVQLVPALLLIPRKGRDS